MNTYYRIQPAGLGINHRSETSNGNHLWLHVFESVHDAICCEGNPADYGDEVVEILAPTHRDNGDVEGVEVNPETAVVVRRSTLAEFAQKAIDRSVDEEELDDVPFSWASNPVWFVARNL